MLDKIKSAFLSFFSQAPVIHRCGSLRLAVAIASYYQTDAAAIISFGAAYPFVNWLLACLPPR